MRGMKEQEMKREEKQEKSKKKTTREGHLRLLSLKSCLKSCHQHNFLTFGFQSHREWEENRGRK